MDAAGRQFTCTAIGHVRSRHGLSVPVLTWATTCTEPGCGRAFEQVTCRKPRPADMRSRCRLHTMARGPSGERGRRRASILDSLVAELRDGRLVTLAGDIVEPERDPEPTPEDG